MKILGSAKSKITKDKNSENVRYLETTEITQKLLNTNKRAFHICVSNKLFGQSLDISPKSFIFLKNFH